MTNFGLSFFNKLPQKKKEVLGVLDLGSERVKFLVLAREKGQGVILFKGQTGYEKTGVFDGRDFELEVIKKAILEVMKEGRPRWQQEIKDYLVNLPPGSLRAGISSERWPRKEANPIGQTEQKRLFGQAAERAERSISQRFEAQKGVLAQEICFLKKEILEINVDGYQVSGLLGLRPKELGLTILATFLPYQYLAKIREIFKEAGIESFEIIHEAQGLVKLLEENEERLYLDIGGHFTQLFLVKKGKLSQIETFDLGGECFSQDLSENLGLLIQDAQALQHGYSRGKLSPEVQDRLKEIFKIQAERWIGSLKKTLPDPGFLQEIVCFGGGAVFPPIREALKNYYSLPVKTWPPSRFPKIKSLFSQEEDYSLFIPSLLLSYGREKNI